MPQFDSSPLLSSLASVCVRASKTERVDSLGRRSVAGVPIGVGITTKRHPLAHSPSARSKLMLELKLDIMWQCCKLVAALWQWLKRWRWKPNRFGKIRFLWNVYNADKWWASAHHRRHCAHWDTYTHIHTSICSCSTRTYVHTYVCTLLCGVNRRVWGIMLPPRITVRLTTPAARLARFIFMWMG